MTLVSKEEAEGSLLPVGRTGTKPNMQVQRMALTLVALWPVVEAAKAWANASDRLGGWKREESAELLQAVHALEAEEG